MGVTERVLKSYQDMYSMDCSKIDKRGGQGSKTIHMLFASALPFCILSLDCLQVWFIPMSLFLNKE